MDKLVSQGWRVIELLVIALLAIVLVALLLGEQAGEYPNTVLSNIASFLAVLPPASIAVTMLIAIIIWWARGR